MDFPPWVNWVLWCVGAAWVLKQLVCLMAWTYRYMFKRTDLRVYGAGNGAWALITGASDGIGKGLATALVGAGMKVVLLARNPEKLEAFAQSLNLARDDYRVISADAANRQQHEAVVARIAEVTSGLPLTMVINNVGTVACSFTDFDRMRLADIDTILDVNVRFTTLLTHALLPQLRANVGEGVGKVSRRGLIANTSSLTAVTPSPLLAVYAATKAFDDHFSYCLAAELRGAGIDVTSVIPGLVCSPASGVTQPSLMAPTAHTFAHATLPHLGTSRMVPYWFHDVLVKINDLLPESVAFKSSLDFNRNLQLAERNESHASSPSDPLLSA